MDEILGIFPIPLMVARGLLPADLVAALIAQFEGAQTTTNVRTGLLAHTPVAAPMAHDNYRAVMRHVAPRLVAYGEALLGEQLNWGVKEIWMNRMATGGAQKMHNHANSFISGIIYLTSSHPSAATLFYRSIGATSFMMSNENERCTIGPFNTPIFRTPPVAPGDAVLFPSYIMHEVPPNEGPPRMTAAFNAIPERVENWGYGITFR